MSAHEYSTYIFDLDGTLLNTLGDLTACVNYALRRQGMPLRTLDEVQRFVGNGVHTLVMRAIPEGTAPDVAEETFSLFRDHYALHALDTTAPYPGIPQLLARLKAAGKNIGVVSNKLHAATCQLCRTFFPDTVQVAIGEGNGISRKPAPDTVVEALRQLGVSHDDTVYIGDSEVDILTARNSLLPCISVLWGFRDRDFLIAHGATRLVSAPEEIF